MLLNVIRILFILSCGALGWYAGSVMTPDGAGKWMGPVIGAVVGSSTSGLMVGLEWVLARRRASLIPTLVLGLSLGVFLGPQLAQPLLLIDAVRSIEDKTGMVKPFSIYLLSFVIIVVIYRTKDEFKFSIPYVQFRREGKGVHPWILDTSAIIDGRTADIVHSKLLDGPLVIPRFVLNELHAVADSQDRLKRNRGRRGLDILQKLQDNKGVEIRIDESQIAGIEEVDAKLVALAKSVGGKLVTTDFNLSKVAQLQGVDVINVNDLATALRPTYLPGESLSVKLIRPGEEAGQGIGYLDDGTMVVVEGGRDHVGRAVSLTVTSSLQTSAGRMIFGKTGNHA